MGNAVRRRRVAMGLACILCVAAAASAADWPQFLGPNRNGISPDATDLPGKWGDGVPRKVWSLSVGRGYAGPAIFGDSVLILDREPNRADVLRRLRLSDGREVWRFRYDAPGKVQYPGSRSTPATDGRLVFTIGPFGHLHAVRFSDGKPVWKGHILRDWAARRPTWGVATSPLLLGDLVIVAPWGRKAAVVAYRKTTGKVAWTTPNPRGVVQEYQSPVPMTLDGRTMIVATGRRGYAIGVDAKTGKQLWAYTGYPQRGWNIPSPIVVGDGRILITGGYGCGSAMFKVVRNGETYRVVELWKNRNLGTKTAQALVYKGHIYGNSADVGGGLRCLTLDGAIVWDSKAQRRAFEMGNLLIADGKIFILNGRGGRLHMVAASPDGYKELGTVSVLSGQQVWAPLAYSNGRLLVRDLQKLVCLDLRAAPQ